MRASLSAHIVFLLHTLKRNFLINAEDMQASFLSASFFTKIAPVADTSFDYIKKEAFCNASSHFFQRVFGDHEANINIFSVGVFDEHITKQAVGVAEGALQFRQYPRENALTFSTVVVAQNLGEEQPGMSPEHFRQNILYASHEFQGHFLEFLRQQSEDDYFSRVDSVLFDEYQANRSRISVDPENSTGNNNIMGMSYESLNKASISVIVIGSVLSALLLFASFKLHRKRKELARNRWKVQDINLATAKSLEYPCDPHVSNDDFSFNPLVSTGFYTDESALARNQPIPSPLFEPQTSENSYSEELERLPRDTIYAPPGKLGVAIDILNGQAVVMKIRKGSPITGMLQEGDILLSIDDVDCSCMTLAEVTFLMVKNMERVRRITFVRRV